MRSGDDTGAYREQLSRYSLISHLDADVPCCMLCLVPCTAVYAGLLFQTLYHCTGCLMGPASLGKSCDSLSWRKWGRSYDIRLHKRGRRCSLTTLSGTA